MGLALEVGHVICRRFNFFHVDFPVREVAFSVSAFRWCLLQDFCQESDPWNMSRWIERSGPVLV